MRGQAALRDEPVNMRHVILGHGLASSMSFQDRLLHILAVGVGAVLASILAVAINAWMGWVDGWDNIWLTSSGFIFALPLILPKFDQQTMILCVGVLVVLSMGIGVLGSCRALILGAGGYHGRLAHEEFDAYMAKPTFAARMKLTQQSANSRSTPHQPQTDDQSSTPTTREVMDANTSFFRLGASMGLGAAGLLDRNAVILMALLSVTAMLATASVVYRAQFKAATRRTTQPKLPHPHTASTRRVNRDQVARQQGDAIEGSRHGRSRAEFLESVKED